MTTIAKPDLSSVKVDKVSEDTWLKRNKELINGTVVLAIGAFLMTVKGEIETAIAFGWSSVFVGAHLFFGDKPKQEQSVDNKPEPVKLKNEFKKVERTLSLRRASDGTYKAYNPNVTVKNEFKPK